MIDLSYYLNTKENFKFWDGTNLFAKGNKTEYIYNKLKNISSHMTLYLRKDIPDFLHIKNSSRTGDILIVAEKEWVVSTYDRHDDTEWGSHGYSHMYRDMNPFFVAFGPAFRSGIKKRCIETVDVYGVVCYILGIKPVKNDGSFSRASWMLNNVDSKKLKDLDLEVDQGKIEKC